MISPEQYSRLSQTAAQQLGMTQQQLQSSLTQEQLNALLGKLNQRDANRIQSILSDENATRQILSNPQVRTLIERLLNQGKK